MKAAVNLKKIRPKGITLHLSKDIEDEIYFWIRSLRKEGIPVTDDDLCAKAWAHCKLNDINNEIIKLSKS